MKHDKTAIDKSRFDALVSMPEFGESAVALAKIAAPFVARGDTTAGAIAIARSLVAQAEESLLKESLSEMRSDAHPPIDLPAMKRRLGVSLSRVRFYVNQAVSDPVEAQRLWDSAKAKGKPFTWKLQADMMAAQKKGFAERAARIAESKRTKKL